jgi:MFS family permease
MNKETVRRYFQFFLIVLAAGAIYPIVYLRTNYQQTLLEVFNISLPQMNTIYSVLGIVWMIGYLPSGLISDKFSAKWLIVISLFGTAAGGFWFAQVPNFASVIAIYCIWGIFSVFTFWSAHMKLVKLLSEKEEEGRFFGILDGGRGVVEALLASLGLFIFSRILGASLALPDKHAAIVAVSYMYSIVLTITAILIWIFVDEKKGEHAKRAEADKFHLSSLPKLLKNKNLYLHAAILFFGYAVTWTVYYLGGFLQTNLGAAPVTVGVVTVVILWMRPVGGFIGGFLADKMGKTKTIIAAFAGAGVCLAITAILPSTFAKGLFFVLVIVLSIFLYAIRGTYWSILGDDKFDVVTLGSAIGTISLIGYLPDILLPQFNSFLFHVFGDKGGYNAYFLASAGMALIGIVLTAVYGYMCMKEKSAAA